MTNDRDFLRPHLLTLPIHRAMLRAVEAKLFAELAPDLPEPIVDIGSGDGTFVEIALPGKRVIGIDPIRSDTHEAAGRGVYAGQHENVLGEAAYARRLAPLFYRYRDHWTFLGTLNPIQMAAFFPNCDLIVVPSLNSTESFGLVQVEAMLCGTPVVMTDIRGGRTPVKQTGMGLLAPPGDWQAIGEAIVEVLKHRARFLRPAAEIARRYDIEASIDAYEQVFRQACRVKVAAPAPATASAR